MQNMAVLVTACQLWKGNALVFVDGAQKKKESGRFNIFNKLDKHFDLLAEVT